MRWEILNQGFVCQKSPVARGTDLAIGPRLAITQSGDVICSFMLTEHTATNDFAPALCRSSDGGQTWTDPQLVWPHLRQELSIFVGISRDAHSHRLFLYGSKTKIDVPGETNWSTQTSGLKANELIWSVSSNDGRTWSAPAVIPMPIPGSAEAPGPLCVTKSGRWLACYAPYRTFDPALMVDRSQVVVVYSDNQGQSWRHTSMLRFDRQESNGAEAWLVELADGRLLGTSWVIFDDGTESPNAYAVSKDTGTTWSKTNSTGTLGQTTALAALPDGRAIFLYNQRKHGDPGVRGVVAKPTETSFGTELDDYLWKAETRTQSESSGGHDEWSDFSFGEPSIVRLTDGTFLAAIWCIQPSGSGIRYVKLKLIDG